MHCTTNSKRLNFQLGLKRVLPPTNRNIPLEGQTRQFSFDLVEGSKFDTTFILTM